jgi:hypothetical protein
MHALLMASYPQPRTANGVDRFGAIASLLCAIHCAVLPFVLALLPVLGLSFLAGHVFERCFVACASALASWSLLSSYRRHRRTQPLWVLLPGLTLLWLGAFIVNEHYGTGIHAVLVAMGGMLLATAHLTNLHLARVPGHAPECRHSAR